MNEISSVVGDIKCLWTGPAVCGEGPIWDIAQEAVYWVDIDGCKAHRYRIGHNDIDTWDLPEKTGWLLPCLNRVEWLAGCKSGIYLTNLDKGSYDLLLNPEPDSPQNRLNDAKIDASGRLWCGTMNDERKIPDGWLYRIDSNLHCTRWDGPFIVTNGPAMTPDDRILYHVNTSGRVVYAFDKSPDGTIKDRRIFAKISADQGKPDGLTVDAEGFIWLAHFGGSRITRFAPDGSIDGVLEVPCPQVTSCTFGGPDMNILFITTAARNIDLTEYPKAGSLFCVETNVYGLPSPKFHFTY